MAERQRYKSRTFEAIHESARALFAVGVIADVSMREFDEACLAWPASDPALRPEPGAAILANAPRPESAP
jgi:putative transcriptional regulator